MKAITKIRKRFSQIRNHPISSNRPIRGMMSYIGFNIFILIWQRITISWIKPLRFRVSKGDAGIVGNIYYGLHEFEDSMFVLHVLRPSDVFIDVGANVGHYTLLASGIKSCRTYCFEPVPTTYKRLIENIGLNNLEGNVFPFNQGLSDKNGTLFFSIHRNTMNKVVKDNATQSQEIAVTTLDIILEVKEPSILKLDVEGYEKFVLEGAKNLLASDDLKAILIELNNSGNNYDTNDEEIVQILMRNGFHPFDYDPFSRNLRQLDSKNLDRFNTIFVKDESWVQNRVKTSSSLTIWGVSV